MPKFKYSSEIESTKLGSLNYHTSRDSSSIYGKVNLGIIQGERESIK